MSEVGELAKEILDLSRAETDTDHEHVQEQLGMEIYDVIWNICDLANLGGVDLEVAFVKKIALNRMRTW